jgi:ABC-type branched-subunit amino acid transport system substrate-binding protein
MKARGIKRIALLSQVHNGILAIRQALMQLVATNQGIEIVANEEVTGDLTDFRGILQRIKSQGQIDAFLPIFFPQQLSVCIKQARAAGITSQLLGFETFEDKDAIKAAEGLLSGAVYATGGDPIPSFVKEYEQRYPGQSYYTANQAYDIIKLFVDATRTDKSGETVVRFLQGVRDRSTSSGAVSITKGNQFRVPATLKKINEQGMAELLGLP